MRKNKGDRACLDLFTTFEIKGLNLDRFINTVRKKGIALYNVKKYKNKRLIVTVSFKESEKFFAIAKELCYNIKKLCDGGRAYPLLMLYRSLGILIGAIIIIALSTICNDVVFGVTFTGSGSIYKRQVEEYLRSQGAVQFSRFSSLDLDRLEDGILSSNKHLTFASCKKSGSRLIVDLELSKDKVSTLDGNVYAIISDYDGVVESVKVYRGTAMVSVGQTVKKGDLLVDGVAKIKDQTVKINVLAYLTLICSVESTYTSQNLGEEQRAIMFAEQELIDYKPLSLDVNVKEENGKYIYTVLLNYRRVICVG